MTSKPKLNANQRLTEFANEGFTVLESNFYSNYCDCNVSWLHKSDVSKHIRTDKHVKAEQRHGTVSVNTENSDSTIDTIRPGPSGSVTSGTADAERAFSSYNKLVCSSILNLADETIRALHSAAWNGDIGGRFRGYNY
jgi:hypothetical protein